MFTKVEGNVRGEAAGLRWLGQAQTNGGAHVAKVLDVNSRALRIEYIQSAAPTPSRAEAFGAALARTHAAGAPWWGCPPPGWTGPGWMGQSQTPLILTAEEAPLTWGEFYADFRLFPFADRLLKRGMIDQDDSMLFRRLAERLRNGDFDSAQPALLAEHGNPVARIHGDLWAGNVLYDDSDTGASLIDPMAHGGHAETDLAALTVFGFPYLDLVYRGYNQCSLLDDGWEERIGLHQLTMVIMHADLFGGSYTAHALSIARQYL